MEHSQDDFRQLAESSEESSEKQSLQMFVKHHQRALKRVKQVSQQLTQEYDEVSRQLDLEQELREQAEAFAHQDNSLSLRSRAKGTPGEIRTPASPFQEPRRRRPRPLPASSGPRRVAGQRRAKMSAAKRSDLLPGASATHCRPTVCFAKSSHSGVIWRGFAALHTAALFGRLDCIQMLVEKYGVSVDLESLTGWRPVHLVMNKESGNRALECLKYLISKNASVNVQNQNGVTPLHKAASEGRTQCVKLLIDAGADVHAKDVEGQEPLELCRMWGHRECTRYLSSAMWKIDKQNFAREIRKLNEIKTVCQAKEKDFLRSQQMKVNFFNNLKFSEWLAKKHLPPPSARILSFLEKRAQSVILRKQWGKPDSISVPPSGREEIYSLDNLRKDRHVRPWNISSNPASVPVACISRPTTVRMGTNPEPSADHDFSAFLFLTKDRCGEPVIHIGNFGKVSPMPALPYETIQRSLFPHTCPTRLRVPQGLKPCHIFDVQRKHPPGPEHRWTDQMALSLRQMLDPTFAATLKAHLETYSNAGALFPTLDSCCGSSQQSSSPSLSRSHLA